MNKIKYCSKMKIQKVSKVLQQLPFVRQMGKNDRERVRKKRKR